MGYIKQGFQLAIGMCLGKAAYDLINSTGGRAIQHLVPEKYWNTRHPDYPIRSKVEKSEKTHSQNPIGFKVD